MKSKLFKPKQRRGLSSIVGALLFVVLMVAAFAVFGTALDSQANIVDTSKVVADKGLQKQKEHFVVNSILQLPGEPLEINVTNKGQNPTEIFTVVITNSSDVADGYPTQAIDIPSDTSFLPPYSDSPTDIVKTLNFTMANNTTPDLYEIKVISSLGNIEKSFVVCQSGICGLGGGGSATGLFSQFLMDGPTGVNTKNSTAIMFVTNTGEVPLTDVAPLLGCSKGNMFTAPIDQLGTADFNPCRLKPTSIDTLEVGQTAVFDWDGVITGEVNDQFLFCNQASGTDPDFNTVTSLLECDDLTVIDPNDCGGCGPGGGNGGETIILLDDLLIRPSIFLTIPSPFGTVQASAKANEDDYLGVWGVNIANPTNSTMKVSKVTITAFAPGANNNIQIFNNAGNNENISPSAPGLGSWHFDDENVIVWKNYTDPIVLGPYSNESFFVKANPKDNGVVLEAVIVQASVFTTSGSFGKSGYQTTMFSSGGSDGSPVANVYLSSGIDSRDSANILGHVDNITNGTSRIFNVTLADMDLNDATYIESGAQLVINVPRDWANVSVVSSSGFISNATEPSVTRYGDNTYQIIGITNDRIGDLGRNASTITFNATAPEKEFDDMYLMYLLANGLTEDNRSVGPLSEVVLHVIGNVTGY